MDIWGGMRWMLVLDLCSQLGARECAVLERRWSSDAVRAMLP